MDLFDQDDSHEQALEKLRRLGYRQVQGRSGNPTRYWTTPEGRKVTEEQAMREAFGDDT